MRVLVLDTPENHLRSLIEAFDKTAGKGDKVGVRRKVVLAAAADETRKTAPG